VLLTDILYLYASGKLTSWWGPVYCDDNKPCVFRHKIFTCRRFGKVKGKIYI